MKLKKAFQLALNILLHSKLRSWLTIIGIIIGIAAIISIISISEGAKENLKERLAGFGADIITITPGTTRAFRANFGDFEESQIIVKQKNLTEKDVLVLKTIPNVKFVMGDISDKAEIKYIDKSATLSVNGVDPYIWKDITTEKILDGRLLTKGDLFSIVLGGDIVKNVFENKILLNTNVLIQEKTFKVVGILEEGSTIYMPITVARTILPQVGEKEFASIVIKIDDINIAEQTIENINKKLMLARGILNEKDKDFSVLSPITMQKRMQETLNSMMLFLGAIAAISLVVGAVGIANTMFTSVLEKTKEIGIMKAIEAKNKDILFIFLFNSSLIGLVGGIGGVIVGFFVSSFINSVGDLEKGFVLHSIISFKLIIGVLLFSILIGIIAGLIPAYIASKLKPVEALRYE